jgi:hypothetical protein
MNQVFTDLAAAEGIAYEISAKEYLSRVHAIAPLCGDITLRIYDGKTVEITAPEGENNAINRN